MVAGEGPAFSSGHDLRELAAHRNDRDGGKEFYQGLMSSCAQMMQAIVALPKPVIAAIEGVATAAGCQLVAACDLAIAGEAARFATPPALTGIVFVRRPPAPLPDTPQSFADYAPGAEVIEVAASLDATNHVTVGEETSLSTLCKLPLTGTDARRATVSWDATKIAFSARTSAADPFHVYVVEAGKCALEQPL